MIRRTLAQTKVSTFCVQLPDSGAQGMPTPAGTGFFVSPDGWFVTATHVVKDKDGNVRNDIDSAWLNKENTLDGSGAMCQGVSLEYVDPQLDVALLKVDFAKNKDKDWLKGKKSFPFIEVSRRQLEEGEPVYSFGYPLSEAGIQQQPGLTVGEISLSPRITSAIVSSTFEKTKMVMSSRDENIYVLDKALNYGNSGGPIVAAETGKVHAICLRFQPVMSIIITSNNLSLSAARPGRQNLKPP